MNKAARGLTPRQRKILETLIKLGESDYASIAADLAVSEITIRRDVDTLAGKNLVQKTKPGMFSLKSKFEIDPGYGKRHTTNLTEKISIANAAAQLIQERDIIGLDASTTTIELAKLLNFYSQLTVVTNSLLVPSLLTENKNIEVISSGGYLRHEHFSLVGTSAVKALSNYNYHISFFSTNAIDVDYSLTDTSEEEADTKRVLMDCSAKKVLLADHTKFKKKSFCKFANVSEFDVLVTDSGLARSTIKEIENLGVEVIVAST